MLRDVHLNGTCTVTGFALEHEVLCAGDLCRVWHFHVVKKLRTVAVLAVSHFIFPSTRGRPLHVA